MNLLGTHNIKTKRLVLRRFVIEDVKDIFTNWSSIEENIGAGKDVEFRET